MDWNKLKAEYIAGGTSYRKLAKKHGVSFDKLKNVAVKEGWAKLKEQAQDKATTKIVNSISKDIAKKSVEINKVADKLLNKISETIDAMETLNSQSIKNFTSALKDIKDIKGIKSEIDLREQEARIDKIRKDIEADNTDENNPCGVVMMPPIMADLVPPKEEYSDG